MIGGMGEMLTLPPRSIPLKADARDAAGSARSPAAAAQGILLALAFSALAWMGLALLVPRLW